jgi:hypothetical protein
MDDHKVITDGVKAVTVDVLLRGSVPRSGAQLFVEHTVTQPLAGLDLIYAFGVAQDEVAALNANVWRLSQYRSLLAPYLPQTP